MSYFDGTDDPPTVDATERARLGHWALGPGWTSPGVANVVSDEPSRRECELDEWLYQKGYRS